MNIFVTDPDPIVSAQNLDSKRVVKMILESAQMLCTALHQHGASHLAKYKATHLNHPSNVWARTTRTNYEWLLKHMEALCAEYTKTYNRKHNCEAMLPDLTLGATYIPQGPLTPFANCAARKDMNIDYKHISDVHLAYKMYMLKRWNKDTRTPSWHRVPQFLISHIRLQTTFSLFL